MFRSGSLRENQIVPSVFDLLGHSQNHLQGLTYILPIHDFRFHDPEHLLQKRHVLYFFFCHHREGLIAGLNNRQHIEESLVVGKKDKAFPCGNMFSSMYVDFHTSSLIGVKGDFFQQRVFLRLRNLLRMLCKMAQLPPPIGYKGQIIQYHQNNSSHLFFLLFIFL